MATKVGNCFSASYGRGEGLCSGTECTAPSIASYLSCRSCTVHLRLAVLVVANWLLPLLQRSTAQAFEVHVLFMTLKRGKHTSSGSETFLSK
jgi:hypothetical protein